MTKIYDFDKMIERHNTNCVKFDGMKELFGREDLIPLWVADMDFETPDFIIDALRERLQHPVLGYTLAYDAYWQGMIGWLNRRHGWQQEREW